MTANIYVDYSLCLNAIWFDSVCWFLSTRRLAESKIIGCQTRKLIRGSTMILGLVILYGHFVTFIYSYFNLRSFNVYKVCLKGQNAQENNPLFMLFTILLPIINNNNCDYHYHIYGFFMLRLAQKNCSFN